STFALRDEWMGHGLGRQGRIAGGYGAVIKFLVSECRRQGASIHLGSAVTAIGESRGRIAACCHDGATGEGDAAILTVPPPILREIALPQAVREKVAASTDIGFGNVVKILLRFTTKWWANRGGRDLTDLTFLFSSATVPTWWTQHPAKYPVLTGWFAGPGRHRRAIHRERACRHGACLARRDFRSVSGPCDEGSRHVTSDQLGQRPFCTRRLFLCHSQNTGSAVGAAKTGWRRRILFWRSAVCRP